MFRFITNYIEKKREIKRLKQVDKQLIIDLLVIVDSLGDQGIYPRDYNYKLLNLYTKELYNSKTILELNKLQLELELAIKILKSKDDL